jgi:transcriptional regulator with GAF, ATPase, and Fis domain
LDEIGDLSSELQPKLLNVLQDREYFSVGGSKVLKTNARVITATNVDLLSRVESGKFREDLYYRLNTVPIYVPPLRERGKDVELLFRKFSSDFAEKYKVKPISLTEDAKQLLLKYRFPGNIRQLKNLVEQISVLSADVKEINAEKLMSYLPAANNLPARLGEDTSRESISEREILYKVLFEMRRDVNELKKVVLDGIKNPSIASDLVKEHAQLFKDVGEHPATEPVLIKMPVVHASDEQEQQDVEDVSHETEDDSLSIEKKEKELIIRALNKNNDKRKYAARDLGISERTLYRKIKQYGLED